jgi:hypothetical protein
MLVAIFSPATLKQHSTVGGAVMVNQQLYADNGMWQFDAPLGLWIDRHDDKDSEGRLMPYGQLRVQWHVEDWEARVEGLIMCIDGCAWRRGLVVARVKPRRNGLSAALWHGTMELELMDWAAQLQIATGGLFGVRAQQRFIDAPLTTSTPNLNLSGGGLTWKQGRHRANLTGWNNKQLQGIWGGYTFTLGELGWHLGAHAGWSSDRRWAGWLGLTL